MWSFTPTAAHKNTFGALHGGCAASIVDVLGTAVIAMGDELECSVPQIAAAYLGCVALADDGLKGVHPADASAKGPAAPAAAPSAAAPAPRSTKPTVKVGLGSCISVRKARDCPPPKGCVRTKA